MDYLGKITLDDLDEEKRQLAELIGIENYRKILRVYPGVSLYIPKLDDLKRMARNEKIRKEFNGSNYKWLATKYRLTEQSVRNIVSDAEKELKDQPLEGQLRFKI